MDVVCSEILFVRCKYILSRVNGDIALSVITVTLPFLIFSESQVIVSH